MAVSFSPYQTTVIVSVADILKFPAADVEAILVASPEVFIDSPANAIIKILAN